MEILVPNSQQRFSNNFCKRWPPNTVDLNRLIMSLCVWNHAVMLSEVLLQTNKHRRAEKFCSQFEIRLPQDSVDKVTLSVTRRLSAYVKAHSRHCMIIDVVLN